MGTWTRFLARVGEGRVISAIGGMYVVLVSGWAVDHFSRGVPVVSLLLVSAMIAVPGTLLVSGGSRLSDTDLDPDLYAGVVGWCLLGFATTGALLVLYHLQPASDLMMPIVSSPLLTAFGAVSGLAVGIYDGQAKMRSRELDRRSTELRDAQDELADGVDRLEHSNERLERHTEYTEHVLDGVDDIFYVVGADGDVRRWNDSLRKVTGYADEQIESMTAAEFFAADEADRIADGIEAGFETGSIQIQIDLRSADGETIPYEFAASILEHPGGETVLAGIGRDVSDRIERERELERRARQQQVVADLGQSALETEDIDALMAEAVRAVADALGVTNAEVLDLDAGADELLLRQGVGWDDGIVGTGTVSAVDADSQAAYTLENDCPIVVEELATDDRFDGPELLTDHGLTSGISTVIGPFDEPWGILGAHDTERRTFTEEDVSFVQSVTNILAEVIERRRYQRELEGLVADLEASNERLEQFAYAASHDLQEPLRMVSSYLQLIEARYAEEFDEDGREFLSFAVDGADRMREMIERLLSYSRVETQGSPMKPVSLRDVLADVRADLQVAIREHDAEIVAEELPTVNGDPNQLHQLFQNLLDNAIEYGGEDPPTVRIDAERVDDRWRIRVSDDGIGIDPAEQDRVFEVFERGYGHRETDGAGIGLALCQRIVERHGGQIHVDSESGEWTTFSFSLPAVAEATEPSIRGGYDE
ncbi:PAS domain-containing sensor histidine kinase [Halolamina salifodinae]|uniref:histidine kinase n=1 Tax=Halolamina salifodinae TaxID=1202767 RepID=A0A8T4H180_9EURY|nr:ATP-binding protein [Halolamina salifodinae]MBP1988322.1 PAS domain S-box-containing protein [Halolamina salifodinae]